MDVLFKVRGSLNERVCCCVSFVCHIVNCKPVDRLNEAYKLQVHISYNYYKTLTLLRLLYLSSL